MTASENQIEVDKENCLRILQTNAKSLKGER